MSKSSPAKSLSKLRRRSWMSSSANSPSRSPSPSKRNHHLRGAGGAPTAAPGSDDSLVNSTNESGAAAASAGGARSRRRSIEAQAPPPPRSPSVPKSFSTDRLPSLGRWSSSSQQQQRAGESNGAGGGKISGGGGVPPVPGKLSSEKLRGLGVEPPRKKDELWSVFRTLDADLQKFQAKSITLKANVVRSSLMPFLKSYGAHPSNHKLRPEDLDRRANILNRWWTSLLEVLHGRNNQSIGGTDRPVILDGITGIMERPEWRYPPSPYAPLADRADITITPRSSESVSASSGSSDFLTESVHHNVRNIFVQNLIAQMSFVVDKMSLRTAPASLVTFCGKTCAYAFMFCPGFADVLVRLWNPTLDGMRRIFDQAGAQGRWELSEAAKDLVSGFPAHLKSLKYPSLVKAHRDLRRPVSSPLGTANWQWGGPWVKRWSGKESDLFYVFVKHYHILIMDFLPLETTKTERLGVPGLIMVHAQILANVEATIHRHAQSTQEDTNSGPSPTFDDVLTEPDASASAMPMAPVNATRLMAENRLIMLIRDFLSERCSHISRAREAFAEAFNDILRSAARRTSMYDHAACYTLCDFLEEALYILVRYEQITDGAHAVLDWPFWLSVFRAMADSHNTTTEIRLYAFLYAVWGTIATDGRRKADVCAKFLLEPGFFESRFNHWCPMVRAYYMRLLCWRIARFDGDPGDEDLEILETLSNRLGEVWAHYLYMKDEAEANNIVAPPTAPSNPAPSRRILIIRTDAPAPIAGGTFLSFDGLMSPSRTNQSPTLMRQPSLSAVPDTASISRSSTDSSDLDEDSSKKKWGLLRTIIGSTSKSRSKSRSPDPPRHGSGTTSGKGGGNGNGNGGGGGIPSSGPLGGTAGNRRTSDASSDSSSSSQQILTHRAFCFKFSLEWIDKRFPAPGNIRLHPPRLPMPAQMFLQQQQRAVATADQASPARSGSGAGAERPEGPAAGSSRYAGRALAEWSLLVNECQCFFERRKNEGVPTNKLVESPTLGVESFRKPGPRVE
ncbi:hypothetical protein BDY21DRAFT_293183 [Lineolata rhizophorae]|uniref:DUF1765-domain-containing protein n=1 Tax=Lineolata rhizophorae TaxID=578093 RepID=A0A6A6NNQ6_9PEZI|nr:hypothetical protein BDY21DRAFT_293183 [Lineolata rhizophorae]